LEGISGTGKTTILRALTQSESFVTKSCLSIQPYELGKHLFTGRDETWYHYIKRFGDSENSIVEFFLNQQKELIDLSKKSSLDCLILDTSEMVLGETILQITDFWNGLNES
jgi:type II secretory pathway predicted ATPase ExeA